MSTAHAALSAPAVPAPMSRDRVLRIALYVVWCGLTLWLASRHTFWRDEVRALSLALAGDDVFEMLRGVQGEGHPVLWYLLLRGGHALTGLKAVLPGIAWLVAAASMAILVWRSPFRLGTIALVLFGFFGTYEYAVSPRNYGISMLVLFAIAVAYPRYRDRGIVLGTLIALLCNTNVPANILAAGLMGFWAIELFCEEGWRWTRKHNLFLINCAVVLVGVILCFIAIYPPVHDVFVRELPSDGLAWSIIETVGAPHLGFHGLGLSVLGTGPIARLLFNIVLAGAVVSLIRYPAAFAAALFAMLSMQLFDEFVYPGSYRHHALFPVFILVLHWLVRQGRGGAWKGGGNSLDRPARIGGHLFTGLLALQVALSVLWLSWLLDGVPNSRSADLAALLRREGLTDAILMANPDALIEPLPYYVDNPIYLIREQRFGHVVRFTTRARRDLTLEEIQADAVRLAGATGRRVVIVLRQRVEAESPPIAGTTPYLGTFSATPEQARAFHAAARRIARFEGAMTDERYDVYLLEPPAG
ncbi:MAG TPA: hypothetical protein VEZ41_05910 [Allosphingosinicella sp.]|nr:hypothetical protein [Allosphingosinicella sp.]